MFHRCSLLFLAQSSDGLRPLRGARLRETADVVYRQFMSQNMHLMPERSMLRPQQFRLSPPASTGFADIKPTKCPPLRRPCRKIWHTSLKNDICLSFFDTLSIIPTLSLQSSIKEGGLSA
jgi:hypothetical protein